VAEEAEVVAGVSGLGAGFVTMITRNLLISLM